MANKTCYQPLPKYETDDTLLTTSHPKPYSKTKTVVLSTFVASLLIFTTIYLLLRPSNTILQCGTTAAEARSKGCHFETASFSWLPPACYDATIDAEFQSRPLKFYRHENYTDEVFFDEVRLGEGKGFYVKQDYHATHCAYLLKKLHRAYKSGGPIDGLITSLKHTGHCVHMILDPPEEMVKGIQFAYTKWPYCGRKGGYNVEWARQGEWTDGE